LGFQFFEVLFHAGEDGFDVVITFARMVFANALNVFQDFIGFHNSPFSSSTGEQITGHSKPHAAHARSMRRRSVGLLNRSYSCRRSFHHSLVAC
jgi:hypothetical protein